MKILLLHRGSTKLYIMCILSCIKILVEQEKKSVGASGPLVKLSYIMRRLFSRS